MTNPLDVFSRRLLRIERQIKRLQGQLRLGLASFDQGAIQQFDLETGLPVQIIGQQFDGTSVPAVFNGPTPPIPSAPSVSGGGGVVSIGWDGTFTDALVAPMDFSRVEAHMVAADAVDFDTDDATSLVQTFETERGGIFSMPAVPGDYKVRLFTRSLSGKRSEDSEERTVTVGAITVNNNTYDANPPPETTEGYPEGHGWWQIVNNRAIFFWRVSEGAWVPTEIAAFDALTAANAFIEALATNDFTVIRSLVARGETELAGPVTLRSTMRLPAGVTRPTAGPIARAFWDSLAPTSTIQARGLTENHATPGSGSAWVTAYGAYVGGISALRMIEINKTSGAVTYHDTVPWFDNSLRTVKGIVRLGGYYYVAATEGTSTLVYKVDATTWTVSDSWSYSGTTPTTFGTDGTDLLFSYSRSSDGNPVIRRFTTAGASAGSDVVGTIGMSVGVTAITGGSADFGASRYVLASNGGTVTRVFNTSGTRQSAEEWALPTSVIYRGLYYDGTMFYGITDSGVVYEHSSVKVSQALTISRTITDGSAETEESDATSFTRPARARVQVELPPAPDDPPGLYGNVYAAIGTARRLQTMSPALDPDTLISSFDVLDTASTLASTRPVGTFADGGIGRIESDDATSWWFEGNDFFLTGVSDPVWTAYTPTLTGSTADPTTSSLSGHFHDDGGVLRIRGRAVLSSSGTGIYQFALPAGYVDTDFVAQNGDAVGRGQFNDASAGSDAQKLFRHVWYNSTANRLQLSHPTTGERLGSGASPAPASGDVINFMVDMVKA